MKFVGITVNTVPLKNFGIVTLKMSLGIAWLGTLVDRRNMFWSPLVVTLRLKNMTSVHGHCWPLSTTAQRAAPEVARSNLQPWRQRCQSQSHLCRRRCLSAAAVPRRLPLLRRLLRLLAPKRKAPPLMLLCASAMGDAASSAGRPKQDPYIGTLPKFPPARREAEKAQKKFGGTGLDGMPRHGLGWMRNTASRIQLEKRTLGRCKMWK